MCWGGWKGGAHNRNRPRNHNVPQRGLGGVVVLGFGFQGLGPKVHKGTARKKKEKEKEKQNEGGDQI